jgi:cell division septal protein FtsQ
MRPRLPQSRLLRGLGAAVLVAVVGAGIVAGYGALQTSSAFPVDRIVVEGGGPALERSVRERANAAIGDATLLEVDIAGVERAVGDLPQVRSATVDRAFPDALVVRVRTERPVARAQVGDREIVLAASGRVLGAVGGDGGGLPRVSVAPSDIPGSGGRVTARAVLEQLRLATAAIRPLGVLAIGFDDGGLIASTRRGHQIRFGTADDLDVKIAAAGTVLRAAERPVRYVDVAVPSAPVLRGEEDDERTAYASPPAPESLRPIAEIGTWIADVSPGESIRTLFG